MSAKNLDRQHRWRSVTVSCRVSPEEGEMINSCVRVSGLTKQDYITRKLTDRTVVVQGNPKVFLGLQTEMQEILEELERIDAGSGIYEDLLERIALIASVMEEMKEESDWKKKRK